MIYPAGGQLNIAMRAQELSKLQQSALTEIARTWQQRVWDQPCTLLEMLAQEAGLSRAPHTAGETQFLRSDLYRRTKAARVDPYPAIRNKFHQFMQTKRANPNQPFGGSDKPFTGQGRYQTAVPGLRHAHITHDLSVVYLVQGRRVYLFGFFTHDDLGTGSPPNLRRQQALAAQISNQQFAT